MSILTDCEEQELVDNLLDGRLTDSGTITTISVDRHRIELTANLP